MAITEKTLGGLTFKIDRPEGYTKRWPGGREFTYPVDYGYFPGHKGEDGEGLDAFVGDDPSGHLESFQKLRRDDHGRMVPDETKFLLGVTDAERAVIYALYGPEVNARRVYRDLAQVVEAAARFKTQRKARYKAATYRNPFAQATAYGPQMAETQEGFEEAFERMRKYAGVDLENLTFAERARLEAQQAANAVTKNRIPWAEANLQRLTPQASGGVTAHLSRMVDRLPPGATARLALAMRPHLVAATNARFAVPQAIAPKLAALRAFGLGKLAEGYLRSQRAAERASIADKLDRAFNDTLTKNTPSGAFDTANGPIIGAEVPR